MLADSWLICSTAAIRKNCKVYQGHNVPGLLSQGVTFLLCFKHGSLFPRAVAFTL